MHWRIALCSLHEIAGDHQGFLIRKGDTLSFLERCERRIEPRCADDRVEHDVDVVARRGSDKGVGSAFPGIIAVGVRLDHSDK